MKNYNFIFIFLVFAICSTAQAIYDDLSMDITPDGETISFCFYADYLAKNNTYLATRIDRKLYFINRDQALMPWIEGQEPPILTSKVNRLALPREEPICFFHLPQQALRDTVVYAGVGASLADMVTRGHYATIYSAPPLLPREQREWTIMVYLVGSSLELGTNKYGSRDILEMIAGSRYPGMKKIHVVLATGGSRRYGWQSVKYALVEDGQLQVLSDIGDKAMSDSSTLGGFVDWATRRFPARHYGLVLWGHGEGKDGFGRDDSPQSKGNSLRLKDLDQAFQAIHTIQPLDAVVYDACLMASLEVAAVTASVASAMGASVELEPGHGIDYEKFLSRIGQNSSANGIVFAQAAKESYLDQAKSEGTYEIDSITYSVFDLTQLGDFHRKLENFAGEFKHLIESPDSEFLTYQSLAQGIIRAPSYPRVQAAQRRRSLEDAGQKRIDFYNVLQSIGDSYPVFKYYADALLTQLNQRVVVDYAAGPKVREIHQDAGRASIDLWIQDEETLSLLPQAYRVLHQALYSYNQRRQADHVIPDTKFTCFIGNLCLGYQWLELQSPEVLGVDAFYGQQTTNGITLYFKKNLYQATQILEEDLKIGVPGDEACSYQLCAAEGECRDIALTHDGAQWLAEVQRNGKPAVLRFCPRDENTWTACRIAEQIDGAWGRSERPQTGDTLITSVWRWQDQSLMEFPTTPLFLDKQDALLHRQCDAKKSIVVAAIYGLNQKTRFATLCDVGDCICTPEHSAESCPSLGVTAGVWLRW